MDMGNVEIAFLNFIDYITPYGNQKIIFFVFLCFLYDAMYYTVRRHDVQIVLLYFLDYITAKYYSVTMCCILSVFEEYWQPQVFRDFILSLCPSDILRNGKECTIIIIQRGALYAYSGQAHDLAQCRKLIGTQQLDYKTPSAYSLSF